MKNRMMFFKKTWTLVLARLLLGVLSACGAPAEEMDMFYTDKNEVYGRNGVSPLGSYEPQAFFEELSAYKSRFGTFSAPEELTAWQSSDGVECLTADLTGVYEVYRGQAAMDKVASMAEYSLTMEELEQVLSANMNGYIPGGSKPSDLLYAMGELEDDRERYQVCLDTFYAVILHNQRPVSSPDDVRESGSNVLYIGFYLPELEMADLTNCNAGSNTQWTVQGKTA